MIVDAHAHIFERVAGMTNGQPTNSQKWGKVKVGNKTFQWFEPSFESSSAQAEMYIAYMDWCNIDKGLIVNNIVYGYSTFAKRELNNYLAKLRTLKVHEADILKRIDKENEDAINK